MSEAAPATDAGLAVGSVVDGRYRIDGVLGSGGMGRVYRGEHTGIGRAVAIKVLHADLGTNREAVTRFQREALASGRLDHPNIVAVSDFGELPDGSAFLVMEALEGEPLGARLERGRLPWREALAVLRGVLAGLAHAHERGVIHRDIKPDNVFLAKKDGELLVKVLDFGIAKLFAGNADDPATTRAGLTIGTPAYLSPEQAVGGEITPATDLYSATVVLFEMLTGRAPFEADDPLQMLGAHAAGTPPALHEVAPDIELPEGIEALVRSGLAKRGAERPASALAYIDAVDAMLGPARRDSRPVLSVRASQPVAIAAPPAEDAPAVIGQAPTVSLTPLPQAASAVTLQDAAREPVPRSWLLIGGAIVGGAVLLAVVLALVSGGSQRAADVAAPVLPVPIAAPSKPAPASARPAAPPKPPAPTPAPAPAPPSPPAEPAAQREERYQAAIRQLQGARSCADRRAAIPVLLALGDARAVAPLQAARTRPFGRHHENTNACLAAEAEAAAKQLSSASPSTPSP